MKSESDIGLCEIAIIIQSTTVQQPINSTEWIHFSMINSKRNFAFESHTLCTWLYRPVENRGGLRLKSAAPMS